MPHSDDVSVMHTLCDDVSVMHTLCDDDGSVMHTLCGSALPWGDFQATPQFVGLYLKLDFLMYRYLIL